jgi:ribonuclease R
MPNPLDGIGSRPSVRIDPRPLDGATPPGTSTRPGTVDRMDDPPPQTDAGAGDDRVAPSDLATVLLGPGYQGSVRRVFIGRVEERGGVPVVCDPWNPQSPAVPLAARPAPVVGSMVAVRLEQLQGQWRAQVEREVAPGGSARAAMVEIAAAHGLDPVFPPAVMRQVTEILGHPGLDDPALTDLTAKPFITIDNDDSRDLDQAMCIERTPAGGFVVHYALADAAYYVKPGTPLFDEAMRRGTSYYLPGLCVPMLPPELSEGLISLNEGQDRRALVFSMTLDANGQVQGTSLCRARIRSRKKLSYNGVQRYFDDRAHSPLRDQEYTAVLENLAAVGRLRQADSAARDVVRFCRREVRLGFGPDGMRFNLVADERNDVEKWNEQISLLCNSEGARFLLGDDARNLDLPNLQGIFKVHGPPPEEELAALERFIASLVSAQGLDAAAWLWRRGAGESLADYLARLPVEGEPGRVTRAIHRRAMLSGEAAEFSAAPGPHFGVGAKAYARFSSPMRELVGIFTHKEALELLAGQAGRTPFYDDAALRDRIIAQGNEAKKRQREITKAANLLAIDALFAGDLERDAATRPRRRGTIMGLAPGKVYVVLDDPPIEVKIYLADLEARTGRHFRLDPGGATARSESGDPLTVGTAVEVQILGYDQRQRHWIVAPAPPG